MNMQALLKQAQKMQKEVVETERELKSHVYTAELSGGAIIAEATGELKVSKIDIKDEALLNLENKEMLEDMLVMVVNEVIQKATTEKDEVMNKLTAGVKMPGGF
ncbi:MAG: YbaB/EbfC family nucleoid-associated protein [Erysipelotrichaceae bacterium]